MGSSDLVNAWLSTMHFGVGSEVWMHRQAMLMDRLNLTVYTKQLLNKEKFDTTGLAVEIIPSLDRIPKNRYMAFLKKKYYDLQNRPTYAGLSIPPKEREWWEAKIANNRPQVALGHFGVWATDYFPIFEQAKIPYVVHFNGYDLSSALRSPTYKKRLESRAPKYAACVVVADYMREWLVDHGVAKEKVHFIPYGAPSNDYQASQSTGLEHCRCLAVGRMVGKKRPDLTIKAFAEAVKDYPNASLRMIGDGPMLDAAKSIASELRVQEKVAFLGYQGPEVVREEMAKASIFVQHSVIGENGDKEGWPVAIAEAACSGLPIVSTRHASIPQQVNDGVSGLLCDEGDWKSMAKNLSTLFKSPELRVKMGNASRDFMLNFETKDQVKKLEQVMLNVAN